MSEPTLFTSTGTILLDEFTALFSKTLDEDFCRTMFKSCVFRLTEMGHQSGIMLHPYSSKKNLQKEPISLEWSIEVTRQAQNTFQDENRTTDFAAMCIAMSLSFVLAKFRYVTVAQVGTGIDFWLTNDELCEKVEARLEVSGIRKATPLNLVSKRLKVKENQVKKSTGSGNPAYIAIVEFSKPEAIFCLA